MKLDFDPGFDITPLSVDEGFRLGADCFDKGTEFRKLDSVRKSPVSYTQSDAADD